MQRQSSLGRSPLNQLLALRGKARAAKLGASAKAQPRASSPPKHPYEPMPMAEQLSRSAENRISCWC